MEDNPNPQAEFYIQKIFSIYTLLSQLTDLSPSPVTNLLFSELVGTCITIVPDEISKVVGLLMVFQWKFILMKV